AGWHTGRRCVGRVRAARTGGVTRSAGGGIGKPRGGGGPRAGGVCLGSPGRPPAGGPPARVFSSNSGGAPGDTTRSPRRTSVGPKRARAGGTFTPMEEGHDET